MFGLFRPSVKAPDAASIDVNKRVFYYPALWDIYAATDRQYRMVLIKTINGAK
jgi:hypothetical protein